MGNNPFGNSSISNESVVQQVINRITDAILTGNLKPGDQLPPEVEMSEMFGVSRNSLRSAIQTLRSYGVLEVRRPEGTFVRTGISEEAMNPILYSILLQKEDSHKEIAALRELVDTGVIRIIMDKGMSNEDIDIMEHRYEALKAELTEASPSVQRIADADRAFHVALGELTENSMIQVLNTFLLNITAESRIRTIQTVFDANDLNYLIKTHRDLLDAIEKKPDSNLEEAIKFSYIYWKDAIKQV